MPGRSIGYGRVSTDDQNLALQIDALTKHGIPECRIFKDKLSGGPCDRPGLTRCLNTLQAGDILVVWRLDRLGRSMRHLIVLIEDLRNRGVGFRSLQEGAIDTTNASGELIFNIFSALAQFERRLIQERTMAGLAVARARGRLGGRPRVESVEAKVQAANKLAKDRSIAIDDICSANKSRTVSESRSPIFIETLVFLPGVWKTASTHTTMPVEENRPSGRDTRTAGVSAK